MPGITGIICKQIIGDEECKLNIMLHSMMHESFYTSDSLIDPKIGVYVGGVCIKGSFPDCMPIYNEGRNIVMFFSGECFEDANVINSIKSRGHEFDSANASYLIHQYEEGEESFFKNLNGWFSGIILDYRKGKVLLFNDRYGMQRIYYHENEKAFYFSSEAKSLLKVLPFLRKANLESIGEYFILDCPIENRTFFSNIFLLPAGSVWSFANVNADKKRYFEPSSLENQKILGKDQFYEELGETFIKVLPRYFVGTSIGMALTGGLDTKMILSCINVNPGSLPCFTYSGMFRDSIDVRIARRVAKACSQTHQTIRLDEKYLSEYPSHVERAIFLTDGLTDVCTADEVYLSKIARQIALIKMTGKFASQVMRGDSLLKAIEPNEQLIHNDFKKYISIAQEKYSGIRKGHNLSFLLYNEIPWYWSRFTSAEYSQLIVRSPYLDNDFVNILYKAQVGILDNPTFQLSIISKNNPDLYSIMTNRGYGGSSSPLVSLSSKFAYKFLIKLDTLLNAEILPYSSHHWAAKFDRMFAPFQASKLVIGFDKFRHYRLWFQKELSQYLQEILLDNRTLNRPYWNKKYIEKIVYDHIKGRGNYLNELRKVLTVELIHRVLIEDI